MLSASNVLSRLWDVKKEMQMEIQADETLRQGHVGAVELSSG